MGFRGLQGQLGGGVKFTRRRGACKGACRRLLSMAFLTAGALATPAALATITAPSSSTTGNYSVSWTSAGTTISRYELWESTNGGTTWPNKYNVGTDRTKSFTSKPAGTYTYDVHYCVNITFFGSTTEVCLSANAVRSWAYGETTVVPKVPTITAPETAPSGAYTVSWTASAGATWYDMQHKFEDRAWTAGSSGAARTKSYTGRAVANYYHRVRACQRRAVNCSAFSTQKWVRVPPGTPTLTAPASDADGAYTLTWTSVTRANKYQLEEKAGNGAWSSIHDAATRSKAVSGKAVDTYSYRLRACRGASNCGSWTATKTVKVPPATPTLTAPASDADGAYTLSWTSVTRANKYQLEEKVGSGAWSSIHDAATRSKAVSSKAVDTYSYRLRACRGASNCGSWTATKTVKVPPGTPTLTAPASDADGAYTLTWTSVTRANKYQLEEKAGSGTWTSIHDAATRSKAVSGKAANTYSYRLRACRGASNCGNWTATKTVKVPPGAPTLTAPSSDSDGSYTVTWTAVSNATKYELEERTGNGSWQDSYSGSSRSKALSGKAANSYTYRVRACAGDANCGSWSATASVSVTLGTTLAAPSLTVPSTDSDGAFTVSWTSVSGASQYVLQEKVGIGAWTDRYTGASTSHALSGKANGTYSYQVKACSSATNCGAWSSAANVSVASSTVETPPAANAPNANTLVPASVRNATDQAGTLEGVFRVSETGAATYRVPLPTAPGTAGVVPDLALAYDSQAGNGLAGLGWRIDGLSSIVRCRQTKHQDGADKALSWGADDRFCLDGQRLVLVGTGTYGAANTEYRTEVDSGVWVFAKGGTTGNPGYFEARAKDGSVRYYGTAPGNTDQKAKVVLNSKTLVWSIRKFEDNIGNPIWYQYVNDADGQRIDEVRWAYGGSAGPASGYHARLEFDYENRNDDVTRYLAGQKVVMTKRLQTVKLRNKPVSGASEALLQTIRLRYKSIASLQDETSRLESLEDCAGSNCLPRTTFEWPARASGYQATAQTEVNLRSGSDRGLLAVTPADINGDGRLDIVWLEWDADGRSDTDHHLRYGVYAKNTATNQYAFKPANFVTTSTDQYQHRIEYLEDAGSETVDVAVLDYNADGRHDVAVWRTRDRRWMVHLSTPQASGGWALTKTAIDTGLTAQRTVFTDVDGDGLADALYTDDVAAEGTGTESTKTYVRHLRRDTTQQATSNRYYAFQTAAQATLLHTRLPSQPDADVSSKPVLNGLDFNGDGLADHLIDYVEVGGNRHPGGASGTDGGGADAVRAALDAEERGIPPEGAQGSSVPPSQRTHQAFIVGSSGTATAYGSVISRALTVYAADLNGDGLTDLIREQLSGNNVAFHAEVSTGTGFDSRDLGISLVRANVTFLGLVDDNGDGHPDFTWHDRPARRIYAYLWDPQTGRFDTASSARRTVLTTDGKTTRRDLFVDMDGDGGADHIHLNLKAAKAQLRLNANAGALPNAVTKITNGLGAETKVAYGTLAQSEHYTRLQLGTLETVSSHICLKRAGRRHLLRLRHSEDVGDGARTCRTSTRR